MRGFTLLLLGSAGAVLGQEARQRMLFGSVTTPDHAGVFLAAGGSCATSETTCEKGCMPLNSVCCGDGTNTFCPSGTECRPNSCCPAGKTCLGGGGPPTCGAARVRCGDGCMPLLGDCCSDGTYCPANSKCSANGCAPNSLGSGGIGGGGVGGGGGGSGSSGSDSGGSGSSGSGSGSGGNNDFPTAPAFTSESGPRPTPTPSGNDDSGGAVTVTAPTPSANDDSGGAVTVTQKPRPTVTVAGDDPSTNSPTTAGGGTPPTTTAFQMSGGHHAVDGKLAAGLAMAAAILL